MGDKSRNVPNGELPSLRPEDINWRPPYPDVTPSWKNISDLAQALDSLDRLVRNPLLYPEGEKAFLGANNEEIGDVYGELHRSLMLGCHVYWRERRHPRLFDWIRRQGLPGKGLPGMRGAELRARLWLEYTAWEYSWWVRRILKKFGCSIDDDIDPMYWTTGLEADYRFGLFYTDFRLDPEFKQPPEGYWNMVETLLDSMPINLNRGYFDERGVLLRWMHLHGRRTTGDTLMDVWRCVSKKRDSFLRRY